MPATQDFAPVFKGLRSILAEYAPKLKVVHDRPDNYYLDTHTIGKNKKPIYFGGVRLGKAYVSYYLMPVVLAGSTKGYVACTEKAHAGHSVLQLHDGG